MSTHTDGGAYFSGDVTFAADVNVHGNLASTLGRQVSVTLTNNQIKSLSATPFVLIPATETLNYDSDTFPSKLYLPICGYAFIDARGGAYIFTGSGNRQLNVSLGSDNSIEVGGSGQFESDNTVSVTGLTNAARRQFLSLFCPGPTADDNGSFQDNALSVKLNFDGTITGGHASNTMLVVVNYIEITI